MAVIDVRIKIYVVLLAHKRESGTLFEYIGVSNELPRAIEKAAAYVDLDLQLSDFSRFGASRQYMTAPVDPDRSIHIYREVV